MTVYVCATVYLYSRKTIFARVDDVRENEDAMRFSSGGVTARCAPGLARRRARA